MEYFNPVIFCFLLSASIPSSQSGYEYKFKITTLLAGIQNNDLEEVEKVAEFLGLINHDIFLHLSRYFSTYKLDNPATGIAIMKKDEESANKLLNRVSLGYS